MRIIDKSAIDLLSAQARGEVKAEDIADAFLTAIHDRDPQIKAFLLVDEDAVRSQACAIDARRAKGERLGKLAGVPVALKDVICTQGVPTTCGSRILQNFAPPYDAHVVSRLKDADAVLIGKTNMDEFAMGSSTENSSYFATRNPRDLERIPGGSSGGSAAAVAAGMTPLAVGSDTGGSIRQPAGLCGVVGVKPTYGRVSRYGLIAYASSLDQIGPFARSVADAALLLEVLAGHDARDSTSVDRPVPDFSQALNEPIRGLRLGVPRQFFGEGLDPQIERTVRDALKAYEKQGAKLIDVSLPHSRYAIAAYYIVATAEASSNLARFDGMHYGQRTKEKSNLIETYSRSRAEGFGKEVQRRIMLGTYALSSGYREAYYLKALKVRRLIKNDFDEAFKVCDAIVGPISPTAAFKIGEKSDDPLSMYLSDIYTIGANLAGIPGMSVPCGFTSAGLPIGLQILAGPFEEQRMLCIARMYERATDWGRRSNQQA